eukprot:CAMPEP_0202699996 /NCGR_PEP_ID=MMETSP1385-20130828/13207_1 /ASSEMBLY_ACC=CAM_ASM_000861 /TAXON_ID=933848 /ORGANISM="Elphidium margaritaceum" /LENGTH=885 /DNA_ID=CAMNT_0049357093 /DNA_START=101 /DNA_END=2758 /DNA_ORIENTATION=+
MSLLFPATRDTTAAGQSYIEWERNEPMVPARPTVCHGLPSETSVRAENQFAVNDIITIQLAGTTPHAGGHCSFWYSTDDVTFTKVVDIKDCTIAVAGTVQVRLPDTLPVACGTKCTFAWTWIPVESQQCEIYSNCADISVSGLTGAEPSSSVQTVNFQSLINEPCQRVDDTTHWSPLFSNPLQLAGAFTPTAPTSPTTTTTPSPVSSAATSSATSVSVAAGDSITIVNQGGLSTWWYACVVSNIADGHVIDYMEVESNGVYTVCSADTSSGSTVYECAPSSALSYPLGVRFNSNHGLIITAEAVILDSNEGSSFQTGINFGSSLFPSGTSSTTTSASTTTTAGGDTDGSSSSVCYVDVDKAINLNNAVVTPGTQCGADSSSLRCLDGECCSQWGYCGTSEAHCNTASLGDWRLTSCSSVVTTSTVPSSTVASTAPSGSGNAIHDVEKVLSSAESELDSDIFIYEAAVGVWLQSDVYRFDGFISGLRTMYETGVSGNTFYLGSDFDTSTNAANGYKYGLVNIAAFLAQSMKETIRYNACDENNWDAISGVYPISNACGQLSQSYQDYECSADEAEMQCEVDVDMELQATTNAKWWGAPKPLFCGPKSKYPSTGYWDPTQSCPGGTCTEYDGQKGGAVVQSTMANRAGRTDVEGCCYWGRGVIQTTGVCNIGKLNYYLGAKAFARTGEAAYPEVDFCKRPDYICSEEYPALKWIAGFFYWVQSVQSYDVGGWNYMTNLKEWVDSGMDLSDTSFIDAVSGIVNRGCTSLVCPSGPVDGVADRRENFAKVMNVLTQYSREAFTFDADDPADAKKNNSVIIIVLVVLAVLLMAAVGAFIFYRRRSLGEKVVTFDHGEDKVNKAEQAESDHEIVVDIEPQTEEANLTQTNE